MKFKPIYLFSFIFYVLGLYLCLVWAKWLPRPYWIQEDIEPVYGVLGSVGCLVAFIWQVIVPISQNQNSRRKNILEDVKLKTKKRIRIGDASKRTDPKWDEKNIVKDAHIETEEDFHLGDN